MRSKHTLRFFAFVAVAALLGPVLAHAQSTGPIENVYNQYASQQSQWISVANKYAKNLFALLALADFTWTAAILALEGHELTTWTARIIRKLMTIGFFAILLSNGQLWMGYIIQSFIRIGTESAGGSGGTVILDQLNSSSLQLTTYLLTWCSQSATALGITALSPLVPISVCIFILLAVYIGFLIIAVNFVITTIESFITIGAGYIFLGFGGSQWTRPYTERYISLAVSVGTRLMLLYMLMGLGVTLTKTWTTQVGGLQTLNGCTVSAIVNSQTCSSSTPAPSSKAVASDMTTFFSILAGAVTFIGVCLFSPRFAASILSGAVSLTGNEAVGMGAGIALNAAALTGGAIAAPMTGGTSLAGAGAAGTAGGAGMASGTLSGGSMMGSAASSMGSSTSMAMSTNVAPPAANAVMSSGQPETGGGSAASVPPPNLPNMNSIANSAKGMIDAADIGAVHTTPPAMNLGGE
jgi:type IV secretion system protein TrbL